MCGNESLLDIGCGPGLLAIGFAPFVKSCTGLDPEAAMITAANAAAAKAGVAISLIQGRIEEFPTTRTYDVITIGRALHWLERDTALPVLKEITARGSGCIVICVASSLATPQTAWVTPYDEARRRWASEPDESRYRTNAKQWFKDSRFQEIGDVAVTEWHEVTPADLIGRALSKSNTSPEVVGEGQQRFASEITAALKPFAGDGVLREQIEARASILGLIP
ncbi:MAG: class I SAM-dependent methyltransferase [Candidatus Korobacteraceae bacterium]